MLHLAYILRSEIVKIKMQATNTSERFFPIESEIQFTGWSDFFGSSSKCFRRYFRINFLAEHPKFACLCLVCKTVLFPERELARLKNSNH